MKIWILDCIGIVYLRNPSLISVTFILKKLKIGSIGFNCNSTRKWPNKRTLGFHFYKCRVEVESSRTVFFRYRRTGTWGSKLRRTPRCQAMDTVTDMAPAVRGSTSPQRGAWNTGCTSASTWRSCSAWTRVERETAGWCSSRGTSGTSGTR